MQIQFLDTIPYLLVPSSDALVPSSFLFLVVMPGATSSFLLLERVDTIPSPNMLVHIQLVKLKEGKGWVWWRT